MAKTTEDPPTPEGINSLLDTDLYKLTMQSAILTHFPHVHVTYSFTNRTPDMKFTRAAFEWLQRQIARLASLALTPAEHDFLQQACPYLPPAYLTFLSAFRFRPADHIRLLFIPELDANTPDDRGNIELHTAGLWLDTILYEIPLLALVSEAYFRFCDTDWSHARQRAAAHAKGVAALRAGVLLSEFGSRRRRDYRTHALVLQGLCDAQADATAHAWPGRLTGTSNVHMAHRFGLAPIGTVAHEWFMGVAAVTADYTRATERALACWIASYGRGVLGIALTDTFGTPAFLAAFRRPVRTPAEAGSVGADPGAGDTYAQAFTGVRQDSGDPEAFVRTMRAFYDGEGITARKTLVFSDALDVARCVRYKAVAEAAGFAPSFGVGTHLTNDFARASAPGELSAPLNIVIKLSSADGKPAVKISDNLGKNTGERGTVEEVKRELGYVEREWEGGDERTRWGGK